MKGEREEIITFDYMKKKEKERKSVSEKEREGTNERGRKDR